MKKIILFISILFLLFACKAKQHITDQKQDSTNNQIVYQHDKLTPVPLRVDSASIRALFRCDSNYNVILAEFLDLKTKGINTNLSFKNGVLDYKLTTGGDTVYIPGSDFYWYINRRISSTLIKTVYVDKKLSWYQKFMIDSGQYVWGALLLIIVVSIVKNYTKIKNNILYLLTFRK